MRTALTQALCALVVVSIIRLSIELLSRLELRRQTQRWQQPRKPTNPLLHLVKLEASGVLEESAAALPQLPPPLPTRRLSPPTSLRSQQQPSVAPPAIELLTDVEPPRTRAFPVLLLTATRGEMLNRTLRSLLAVRGLNASEVFVVQDGTDESVARVVRWNGLRLVQHETSRPAATASSRGGSVQERGQAVARAYKWALRHAFDVLTTDEAVIIVEDDLYFSPDLMEYFLAGWSVQRADPTLWCTSAWNDNGFGGLAREPKRVMRTGFFPGLGWLLSRALWKDELEPNWPREHWDHWMRSETKFKTSRGRECLIPQVPRTYHHGDTGTFMIAQTHEKYFSRIAHNIDPDVGWPAAELRGLRRSLSSAGYEAELRERLRRAAPLRSLAQLQPAASAGTAGAPSPLALWYSQAPRAPSPPARLFSDLAKLLGIWHEMRRGSHFGVHELWCNGRQLMLVNLKVGPHAEASPYTDLAPPADAVFTESSFGRALDRLPAGLKRPVCTAAPALREAASSRHDTDTSTPVDGSY